MSDLEGGAKCRSDQMLNPATNRCVLRNGQIGRALQGMGSPRKSPAKMSPKASLIDELMQKVKAFTMVQLKYSKWGANDSESQMALRDVVEGQNPSTAYWGLFPRAPIAAEKELIKTSRSIQEFINKHAMNKEIKLYLRKTSNLRYL